VADEACTNKLSNEGSQVGRNSTHAIPQVFCELCAVLGDGDDLVA